MKIYIMRHEDRPDCTGFFTPLTEKGLENSIKLIKVLKKLHIDTIYSSPYIRTLQTIYPYSQKYEIKIQADYALGELKNSDIIAPKSKDVSLPEYLMENFNCDLEYESSIKNNRIKYPEKVEDLKKRTIQFFKDILTEYNKTNNVIILVTHQIVCNILCSKANPEYEISTNYPKGGVTKIFDKNKLVFEPINW